jgi:hypothetical protein
MKTDFHIYTGEIKFLDNRIKIKDGGFKWHKKMSIAYSVFFILAGAFVAGRYFSNHHIRVILEGGALILVGIITLAAGRRVNTDTEIDIRQVEKAVISENFLSYLNLTLYLKNSQKRKIALDYRDEDHFRQYFANDLVVVLKSHSITTQVI